MWGFAGAADELREQRQHREHIPWPWCEQERARLSSREQVVPLELPLREVGTDQHSLARAGRGAWAGTRLR